MTATPEATTKITVTLPITGDHELKGTTGYFTAREARWEFTTGVDRDGHDTHRVAVHIAGPKSRVKSKYPGQSSVYLSVPWRPLAPPGGWHPGDVEDLPEWCPRPPMPYSVIEDAHEYAASIRAGGAQR